MGASVGIRRHRSENGLPYTHIRGVFNGRSGNHDSGGSRVTYHRDVFVYPTTVCKLSSHHLVARGGYESAANPGAGSSYPWSRYTNSLHAVMITTFAVIMSPKVAYKVHFSDLMQRATKSFRYHYVVTLKGSYVHLWASVDIQRHPCAHMATLVARH